MDGKIHYAADYGDPAGLQNTMNLFQRAMRIFYVFKGVQTEYRASALRRQVYVMKVQHLIHARPFTHIGPKEFLPGE